MNLSHLNDAQKQAVSYVEGPLLVVAGAGAGKTRVITERIKYLISKGEQAKNILAITFTNKAADEMRTRVTQDITSSRQPVIKTFHSLAVSLLREFHKQASLVKHFSIFDRSDSVRMIRRALKARGYDTKEWNPKNLLSAISRAKSDGYTPDVYQEEVAASNYHDLLVNVWRDYQNLLHDNQALDFDDLLVEAVRLLQEHSDIREILQSRWKYLHIDEYQDTNRIQYQFATLLVGEEQNICAVGDIDQTIYTWRGARIEHMLSFENDFPQAKIVRLEQNYRSTQTIISAANEVIKNNNNRLEKNLFTENQEGNNIFVYARLDESDEARHVAELIQDGADDLGSVAILYRANFQSRPFESEFIDRGIPYQVVGTKFFDRKEVKDVLAYLELIVNPDNQPALARATKAPRQGIGEKSLSQYQRGGLGAVSSRTRSKVKTFMNKVAAWRATFNSSNLSLAVETIIKESGLEDMWQQAGEEGQERLENIYELVSVAKKYDHEEDTKEALVRFLEEAALISDQDELDECREAVRLLTVHAAKGLEFDTVFVVGMEDSLFPQRKDDDPDRLEEERRLFYVALTRAKRQVNLSYAQVRTLFGSTTVMSASPFISEIPDDHLEREELEEMSFSSGLLDDIEF